MVRSEAAPASLAEYNKDKQSHSLPGSRAGPNKEGGYAIGGEQALGTEVGAEKDARRERAEAIREGDVMPPTDGSRGTGTAGNLGFGQQTGFEKGFSDTPSSDQREENQEARNKEWNQGQPDLRNLARSSGAAANHNPTQNRDGIVSTANRRPEEILDTAGRSQGTESGTGAYAGGIVNQAGTDNVPDQ